MGLNIIAHRGLWRDQSEQNTLLAVETAWASGFGVETDIRDRLGRVVVSHDPPESEALLASVVFSRYANLGCGAYLALNIKSDGLGSQVKELIQTNRIKNYFLFDMSVPQLIKLSRLGLRCFTRESEYENHPSCYHLASGVWMDQFDSDWIGPKDIMRHFSLGKDVAVVSPELHGRPHKHAWEKIRQIKDQTESSTLFLCTDFPQEAKVFFDV